MSRLTTSVAGLLLASAALAPAPASAGAADDWGSLIITLLNGPGFSCGTIATILTNTTEYSCTLEGAANASAGFACINNLDAACVVEVPEVDFAAEVQPIFDDSCASCHGGASPSAGLDLSSDAYDDIVNVASSQLPLMDLVEPGDADDSYLMHKLNGTHLDVGGSGSQMPLGSSLGIADIATIRDWINGGAEDSEAGYTYTLTDDIQPLIFNVYCTDCHSIVGGTNGSLQEGEAYDEIVNVPSSDIPSMDRIEPGDPDNSYLYHKVAGTHLAAGGAGGTMPITGDCCLSTDELDMLSTWIEEGAPE